MNNFTYDGTYPGFSNGEWIVDERDGNIWINLPSKTVLQGFPKDYSIHFMENPIKVGATNINWSDEIFNIPSFKFDSILSRQKPKLNVRDYYETIVGRVVNLPIPASLPPGVTVSSIVLKDKVTNQAVNVINLLNVLVFDLTRSVSLHFGVAVRIATYGLVSYNNIDLTKGRSISFDTFYIESPITDFTSGLTRYSSPEDYNTFSSSLTSDGNWFELYSTMGFYPTSMLTGPRGVFAVGTTGLPRMTLSGLFNPIRGYTGIKSIKIPYCPGVSLVINVTEFNDNGVKTPYLDITNEKRINFQLTSNLIEVSR